MDRNDALISSERCCDEGLTRRASFSVLSLAGAVGLLSTNSARAQEVSTFSATTQAVSQTVVPANIVRFVTQGFYEPGGRGMAWWRRVSEQPKHPGFIRDRSGAIFEIDEDVLQPEMFGALGGNHDDYISIQHAVSTSVVTMRRLEFSGSRYSFGGEIVVPSDANRFALIGTSMTELVQLHDNKCIFLFAGENTHHWVISGFRFAWKRDQKSHNRNSYAVRFEVDKAGGAGHWNFEISHCILTNGFRGFGQPDDSLGTRPCPVWGATFRRIHVGITHTGAAIYLRTYGRSGQPNNRIEQFYARGDSLSEPAIVIESSDTTVLTSVEFNRGKGCQVLIESSSNVMVRGMRFEHVAAVGGEAFVLASGGQTNVQLSGISVQSLEFSGEPDGPAIVRSANGARVKIDGFTDMPWRAPTALRNERTANVVAIADADGGHVTVDFIAPIYDPALSLARVRRNSAFRFGGTESYDFFFEGLGLPTFEKRIVRQSGAIVAVTLFSEGISAEILQSLAIECNGKPIVWVNRDIIEAGGRMVVLGEALKADEERLLLTSGSILSLSIAEFDAHKTKCSLTMALITTGV